MGGGGIVERLHQLRGDSHGFHLAGHGRAMLHIVHKGVDFVGEHIGHFKVGGVIDQRAVLGGIQGKFAAILQANACLVAHEIDSIPFRQCSAPRRRSG